MVVQHNLQAMNSNRMLGITTSSQAKSTERLSSGYKINRAADDAAGLAISEKMRKQIRGLTQASANAQDGISAVQTAEGALTEVHDMLQRMNELAVKASNGTNSESDRQAIQDEIDQLVTEIDRVSQTTKFNETYLLQGDAVGKVDSTSATASASTDIKVVGTTGAAVTTGLKVTLSEGTELTAGTLKIGTVTASSDKGALDTGALSGELKTALDKAKGGDTVDLTYTAGQNGAPDTWKIGSGSATYNAEQLKEMGLNVTGVAADVKITKKVDAEKLPAGVTLTTATASDLSNLEIGQEINATLKADRDANGTNIITLAAYDATYVPEALQLDLQVGADTTPSNKIGVSITSMSANSLGLVNEKGQLLVNGDTSENADNAVNTIAAAIQKVSDQRSALGAVQNRLEHTINNLDNVVENTTAAESQIRDTDIATEMVKYSNNNILQQAGTSMLSQANQSNQLALSLLG